MSESDYIIRAVYRHSTFYTNRQNKFISFDSNGKVSNITDLGTLDSSEIICDGCNNLINSDEILSMFYLNDAKLEVISRAECQVCYDEYFTNIPITPNDLFNLCSRIVFKSQCEEYKGFLIDLQSANLYCRVWMAVNHENRLKLETMAGSITDLKVLFAKLWAMTSVKRGVPQ